MLLEHLLADIDTGIQLPQLAEVSSLPSYIPDEPITPQQMAFERMREYNVASPFTPQDKRRILENMMFNEALMAVKSADRLAAMEKLGKIDGINLFAPEKRQIEIKDVSELRERITSKLGALLEQADDAETTPLTPTMSPPVSPKGES